jgi:hypothetical protein
MPRIGAVTDAGVWVGSGRAVAVLNATARRAHWRMVSS